MVTPQKAQRENRIDLAVNTLSPGFIDVRDRFVTDSRSRSTRSTAFGKGGASAEVLRQI
jgi:hypothetical protein